MLELFGLFLSTWAFGSIGGTAYAAAHGFSNLQTIVIIALINALLVIIWFGIIGFVVKKFKHFMERYKKRGVEIPFLTTRKSARNLTTVGLGLVAAFTIGSMWAVIGTYVANANKWLAWAVITPCAVTAGLLWTLSSLGVIPFLPSPWWLYFVAVGVTIALVGRKVYQNFDQVKRIIREIRGQKFWLEK